MPEGLYLYYAVTPCGNRAGTFNINVTKELIFECSQGLEISLFVPVHVGGGTSEYCYPVFDYTYAETSDFSPYVWGSIGTNCQTNQAKSGDTINFYNPNYADTFPYNYENDGIACYSGGNGYYADCPDKQ